MNIARFLLFLLVLTILSLCGCAGHWKLPEPPPVVGDDPAIRITEVEWWKDPFGKVTQIFVKGRVYNVRYGDVVVSIWIYVPGAGWWPKPTFAHPLTEVNGDGAWHNRVVTGGHDEDVTEINVFLLRKHTWSPTNDGMPTGVNPAVGVLAMDHVVKPQAGTTQDANGVIHVWRETQ